MSRKKVTILDIQKRKQTQTPITMLTAYDFTSAILVDQTDIDIILVGDSLGMVMLGYPGTTQVTMDEMLHHCKAVARGTSNAFLVGDMPFMSYQPDVAEAVRNAGRFLKEAGMDCVKVEGGREIADTVRAIVRAGIPVMGHIGLTPQTVSQLGGFRIQGKTAVAAQSLLEDALALQEAGCFAMVLEAIPATVATQISQRLAIPTIGIGAGVGCDGQVLVYHDMLGLYDRLQPRFVKEFGQIGKAITTAVQTYTEEVRSRQFPAEEHTYPMNEAEEAAFLAAVAGR
ncbi:MAG: 3-methyl-2-oxobutanoate hydroxymethyltransferase [Ardenticatenaceae bacterium]|nr:3-methyl-2-oxobutanoate hydroxymethyltransferase [Anaerolineales bacterium]MCB8941789.1 3-methyl-2-oxobutanoate hydroxymethyltransferase [Ardenticatenaceae bacterium]MCB8972901.1 3-methyl-2-oxobutanoate hydroxymethyltransferase [Ardenticatenaceae bacterium]